MTEKQAGSEKPDPASASKTGAEAHAHAAQPDPAPATPSAPPSHSRLLDWQGPAFWMSCGALLAGLAAGAVVLAQRVGVERDLMAVATTLPPREAAPTVPSAKAAAARRHEVPPHEAEAGQKPGPTALAGTSGQEDEAQKAGPIRQENASASRGIATRVKHRAGIAKHPTRKKTAARRKAAGESLKYAEVFKRCPPPGQPGAVECRRHICNGAESEGPACTPYRGKLR